MYSTRAIGQAHIYLDSGLIGFSNMSTGLLVRAIGHGLKVAYVDVGGEASKFTNFLENASLSHSFVKKFDRLHIEIFQFKKNNKVAKAIIPSVEFYTINESMFWDSFKGFDLVIFENSNFEKVSKEKMINFLKNRDTNLEVVFTMKDSKEFDEVKDYFDLVSKYNYHENKGFGLRDIFVITGNGKGKSTYGFGYMIRNFIEKKDVKLVYFDKGGDFYGERVFFDALKPWSKQNKIYGDFDYVATGMKRFDGRTFRFENVEGDFREAKEGLMLLRTALKKQSPVIADEINTTIQTGLLELKDLLKVLDEVKNQLVMTGRYCPPEVFKVAKRIVEVEEVKHYLATGQQVRKGIDF